MKVVVNGHIAETIETLVSELTDLGVRVVGVCADISRTEGVDLLFKEATSSFGTIDLLINNAALVRGKTFFEMDETLLDLELATNIRAPYLCAYRAADLMRHAGGGNIIHISSVGASQAHWTGHPYDATKGAIEAMTRAMALSLAEFGIRVNAIAPGAIHTERRAPLDDPNMQAVARRIPLARYGTALEIGATAAFLASEEASYITGQVITVDGGITAQLSPPGQPI